MEATQIVTDLKTSMVSAAALASALRDERASTPEEALEADPARAAVLRTMLDAEIVLGALWGGRKLRGDNLVSALSQAAAAAAGTIGSWADLSDEAMIAQGRSSELMAQVILARVAPAYGFLDENTPSRVLDVGTGIGAIATALATARPSAEVTGIDIAERPLEIARGLLRELDPGIAERIHLRRQDVTDLADAEPYDVVWMPMPFLPDTVAERALNRVTEALRPDGMLVLGTNSDVHDERVKVTNDWLASLTGGGTLTTSAIEQDLARRGYTGIRRFDTVPGGPVLLAAVRAA
ncbi:class I SAM-dependent methyltransferase [Herbiconiux sp. UC225_62]|uniref:class I SAM-dependent methyltransferase n=1 Tax=Herbiconiux sp. UC225_62 TaxID=3350168 RepID=UPI0036D29856